MSAIGPAMRARIAEHLSDRDGAILRFLSRHRYATTTHIRRRFFTGHASQGAATRATIRVLDRLLSLRVLARLERRIGGVRHGSAGFIWHLDAAGEHLTRDPGSARRRYPGPSTPFLDHTLQITDTAVALHEAALAGHFTIAKKEVEAEAWRSYLGPSGAATVLKPDLFVTLTTSDYDDHWYLEIDRGTEWAPTLLGKCRAYEHYRRTGRAQKEHGVFPRVLWIVPTDKRAQNLRNAIAADTTLTDRLFVTTTPDHFLTVLTIGADGEQ